MDNNIRHCGVIESIEGHRIRIHTVRSSACDSCGASSTCNGKRGKDFSIDITDESMSSYKPGDRVYVEISAKTGRQAVAIGFALPLIIFVATLLTMHYAGCSDGQTAMGAIASLAIYYLIIYMVRKKINRHFTIRIIPNNY